jgi:hypothetical protein
MSTYSFPYYALVEITIEGRKLHIPAPFFDGDGKRAQWAASLPVSDEIRDPGYFKCPLCGERSFYSGFCCGEMCFDHPPADEAEVYEKYDNAHAKKMDLKDVFLQRLDAGEPLGIENAEMVLDHNDPQNEYWNKAYEEVL